MKWILVAALVAASGCAHQMPRYPLDARGAAADDDRTVLVEFWASWCGPCRVFEEQYLPDPAVRAALAHVRFVRYDVDSPPGREAHRRLLGERAETTVPLFLGIVDDHVVRWWRGLPPKQRLVKWLDGVASLGGSEQNVALALATAKTSDSDGCKVKEGDCKPCAVARAARWYAVHQRRAESLRYYGEVAATTDPELSAEADWELHRAHRSAGARDARDVVEFARRHVDTDYGEAALQMAAVLDGVRADELEAIFRAWLEHDRAHAPDHLNNLTYCALAAHRYDVALEIAEAAMRVRADAATWDTLAEVHYYRGDAGGAAQMAEHAVALSPGDATLRANLARFRRADGTPCAEVERKQREGRLLLPRFYGEID